MFPLVYWKKQCIWSQKTWVLSLNKLHTQQTFTVLSQILHWDYSRHWGHSSRQKRTAMSMWVCEGMCPHTCVPVCLCVPWTPDLCSEAISDGENEKFLTSLSFFLMQSNSVSDFSFYELCTSSVTAQCKMCLTYKHNCFKCFTWSLCC